MQKSLVHISQRGDRDLNIYGNKSHKNNKEKAIFQRILENSSPVEFLPQNYHFDTLNNNNRTFVHRKYPLDCRKKHNVEFFPCLSRLWEFCFETSDSDRTICRQTTPRYSAAINDNLLAYDYPFHEVHLSNIDNYNPEIHYCSNHDFKTKNKKESNKFKQIEYKYDGYDQWRTKSVTAVEELNKKILPYISTGEFRVFETCPLYTDPKKTVAASKFELDDQGLIPLPTIEYQKSLI